MESDASSLPNGIDSSIAAPVDDVNTSGTDDVTKVDADGVAASTDVEGIASSVDGVVADADIQPAGSAAELESVQASLVTAASAGESPAEVKVEPIEPEISSTESVDPMTEGTETAETTMKVEDAAAANDEESDMNVGSDGFDTPPPADQTAQQVPQESTLPIIKEEQESAPSVPIPTTTAALMAPAVIPQASLASASTALATAGANEQAASAFLKQTFDSFSKSNGNIVKSDPEEYRDSLKARLQRDRRDGDAWLALISDTNARANLEEMREVYEDFFNVFPNAARQWQDYAGIELANSEFERVEAIFTRSLRTTPSTDLWRFYLSYTRRVNPLPAPTKGTANGEDSEREKVRKTIEGAYDFALRFIGQSRDSGEVWREYISLLKEREASNQWQAGQKMDDIRRAYQRAVAVPLANIEVIWREYDAYENGLNRITAKKFLAEKSPAYMTARTVFREMKTLTDGLYRPNIAKVPSWAALPSLSPIVSPLTIARDRGQVEAWKKYLQWEEGNPLQLEDAQTLQSRILVGYRKATMHLRFFPEVWYMAANYCIRSGRLDEAVTWLKNGIEACTGSFLLHFAYIELGEARSQTQDAAEIFTSLIEWIHGQIEALQTNLDAVVKEIDDEGERLKAEASARRRDEGAADLVEGEEREELRKLQDERDRRKEMERERVRPKIEEMKEHASLVWIKYMHFVRRHEGQRPSRAIFAKARKSKYCTWQVFEANALMEYHCSKEVAVATKVFELALKTYGDDEAFVVRYLDFLLSINDDNNARALFERTVGTFPPERARPIWDRWSEYEYSFGDSASIAKIDERLAQVYPDENPVKRLVDRNSYMDLDVVGPRDLGLRTVIGGASAAERAVAASKEIAAEAAGGHLSGDYTAGPSGRLYGGEEYEQQPPVKRARFGMSPVPPAAPSTGAANARSVPPPRGAKRSVSPPSRFVPPPRGEPPAPQPAVQAAPPVPQYLEIPDGVLYFLDSLPSSHLFDGPVFKADDIIESLLRSNLPLYDSSKAMSNGNMGARGRRRAAGRGRR